MKRKVARAIGGLILAGALGFVAFTVSFRTKFRPVLDAIRRFNRDVVNPLQRDRAGNPGEWASLIHHVGRISATTYTTPVVAVETDGGFLFALPYGSGTDWVRNILASGTASLDHDGRSVPVDSPTLVAAADADPHFKPTERRMHRIYGVDEFLHVREAAHSPGPR